MEPSKNNQSLSQAKGGILQSLHRSINDYRKREESTAKTQHTPSPRINSELLHTVCPRAGFNLDYSCTLDRVEKVSLFPWQTEESSINNPVQGSHVLSESFPLLISQNIKSDCHLPVCSSSPKTVSSRVKQKNKKRKRNIKDTRIDKEYLHSCIIHK